MRRRAWLATLCIGGPWLAPAAVRADEALWSLLKAGEPVFTLPKIAAVRSMLLNHTIHHRGQLTVYMRLNNIAVPSIYGPSADERTF